MKYTIQIPGLYFMFALHCKLEIKFGFQRSVLYFIYMPKSAVDFPFYQCNAASTISHKKKKTRLWPFRICTTRATTCATLSECLDWSSNAQISTSCRWFLNKAGRGGDGTSSTPLQPLCYHHHHPGRASRPAVTFSSVLIAVTQESLSSIQFSCWC